MVCPFCKRLTASALEESLTITDLAPIFDVNSYTLVHSVTCADTIDLIASNLYSCFTFLKNKLLYAFIYCGCCCGINIGICVAMYYCCCCWYSRNYCYYSCCNCGCY